MKTAMQELIDFIESTQFPKEGSGNYIYEKAKKLLKIEKEQIIDAFEDGKENGRESMLNIYKYLIGEFYYNQTYNQDRELPKYVKDMLDNL
jgi:hypothetical protein